MSLIPTGLAVLGPTLIVVDSKRSTVPATFDPAKLAGLNPFSCTMTPLLLSSQHSCRLSQIFCQIFSLVRMKRFCWELESLISLLLLTCFIYFVFNTTVLESRTRSYKEIISINLRYTEVWPFLLAVKSHVTIFSQFSGELEFQGRVNQNFYEGSGPGVWLIAIARWL